MKKYILLNLLQVIWFYSCTGTRPEPEAVNEAVALPDTVAVNDAVITPAGEPEAEAPRIVHIRFKEFSVTASGLLAYEDKSVLTNMKGDSCYVLCEVGESVMGAQLSVTGKGIKDIRIEQRYETSLSILNDGPHCDLLDWKHYNSEWAPIQKTSDAEFVATVYNDDEYQRFPPFTIQELREYVRSYCGEEWPGLIQDRDTINNGSFISTISRIFLRVTATETATGNRIVKYITFKEPMGC